MNLANIDLGQIYYQMMILEREARYDSLSLDCMKLYKLIQTAKLVFKNEFKLRVGKKWFSDLMQWDIRLAKDSYDSIELHFKEGAEAFSLVYGFDEEAGVWMQVLKQTNGSTEIVHNLILTQKIAARLNFEINLGSFSVVEIANNLRKP